MCWLGAQETFIIIIYYHHRKQLCCLIFLQKLWYIYPGFFVEKKVKKKNRFSFFKQWKSLLLHFINVMCPCWIKVLIYLFKNILTDPKLINSSEQCFKNPLNSNNKNLTNKFKWQVNYFFVRNYATNAVNCARLVLNQQYSLKIYNSQINTNFSLWSPEGSIEKCSVL